MTNTLLFIGVILTLLVPTNPDYTFPLIPELVLIFCISSCLFVYAKRQHTNEIVFSTLELWLIIGAIVQMLFILLPRLLGHLIASPGQLWIPCLAAGKLFYQIECFFQSAIIGHYGVRTFYMLGTALVSGLISYGLVRLDKKHWPAIVYSILAGGLLVALSGFYLKFSASAQLLPTHIMYNNFGNQRMTAIFSNPGWVWPYLTPSLVIATWGLCYGLTLSTRLIYGGIFCIISTACLLTAQRGGLLLVGVFFGLVMVDVIYRSLKNKKLAFALLFLIPVMLFILVLVAHDPINRVLSKLTFVDKDYLSLSHERLSIWTSAWNLFVEKPWFGYGYASWFAAISSYAKTHANVLVLDTAHNLMVQMLVELGLLHSLVILALYGLLIYLLLQRSATLKGKTFLSAAFIAGLVTVGLVQEIDYIRPTFYTCAILCGGILGHHNDQAMGSQVFLPKGHFFKSLKFVAAGLCLGAALCLLGIFKYFSRSFFPFEANLANNTSYLSRWSDSNSSVPAFRSGSNKFFSLFSVSSTHSQQTVHLENKTSLTMSSIPHVPFFLPLTNGNRWWPTRNHLAVHGVAIDSRMLGLYFKYPPLQVNNGIIFSSGMYDWEFIDQEWSRWCGKDCWFVIRTCDKGLNFNIATDLPNRQSQQVTWKIWPLGTEIVYTDIVKRLETPPLSTHEATFIDAAFATINTKADGTPEGTPEGHGNGYFLVQLLSKETFVPSAVIPGNTDPRELAVLFKDSACPSMPSGD